METSQSTDYFSRMTALNKRLMGMAEEQNKFPELAITEDDLSQTIRSASSSTYLKSVGEKKIIPKRSEVKEFRE